jgi:L-fuculose-phosphate aldolase
MSHVAAREAIIETALDASRLGLNLGASGKVSQRVNGGFLITPTGLAYDDLAPADIVFMTDEGDTPPTTDGTVQRLPSSEWRFHLDIYRAREDVAAIVHTHSLLATALSCLHRDIPDFHYMVAVAGGADIRCAPYATFGTEALSENAVAALDGRTACLLANHGQIATGNDLNAALGLAQQVEALAAQYLNCLQVGEPQLLGADEMARVLEKFKTYGQQSGGQEGEGA